MRDLFPEFFHHISIATVDEYGQCLAAFGKDHFRMDLDLITDLIRTFSFCIEYRTENSPEVSCDPEVDIEIECRSETVTRIAIQQNKIIVLMEMVDFGDQCFYQCFFFIVCKGLYHFGFMKAHTCFIGDLQIEMFTHERDMGLILFSVRYHRTEKSNIGISPFQHLHKAYGDDQCT